MKIPTVMTAFPTVMCAICNKPVPFMETFDDHFKGTRTLKVRCHGEWDQMTISDLDLMKMDPSTIDQLNTSVGYAFTTKKLEFPQKKTPDLSGQG